MIYTNGCSFTYGDELSNSCFAWPHLLGNKLKLNVVNDAVSGGTNSRTMYRTIKHLNQNFDLYVIAWTFDIRYTFYKSDNNFEVNFNPQLNHSLYSSKNFYHNWGQTLYKYWHNDLYAFKLWLQQIIQLQSMFEKYKKKYIMINTSSNNLEKWLSSKHKFIDSVKSMINFDLMNDDQIFAEYEEIQNYVQCIDKKTFYKWNQFSILDLTEIYPIGPNGHILEEGHSRLANLLFEYIKCLK